MKIEIKRITAVDGVVYYYVYIDNSCERSFTSESDAEDFFNLCVENFKSGLPKTEIIKTIEL